MQQIINLFLRNDGFARWMEQPFTNAERTAVFTTDTFALVRIADNDRANGYENREDKIKGVLPEVSPENGQKITLVELQNALDKIPLTNKERCSACNGSGEVEWTYEEYTQDFECPVCNGIGEIIADKAIFNNNAGIKINERGFLSKQIKRIAITMQLANCNECEMLPMDKNMTIFKISDAIWIYQMEYLAKTFEAEITSQK